jgi:hypothetical protein
MHLQMRHRSSPGPTARQQCRARDPVASSACALAVSWRMWAYVGVCAVNARLGHANLHKPRGKPQYLCLWHRSRFTLHASRFTLHASRAFSRHCTSSARVAPFQAMDA